MVIHKEDGPETSYEERYHKRARVMYMQQTRERQYFMQELNDIRKERHKKIMQTITDLVGPTWYQVLSVPQRTALDTLEISIYQDLLEGRPVRVTKIVRKLGIVPCPNYIDLMNCVFAGKDDPKAMLAELFQLTYGHGIEGRRTSYDFNAKLILTSIFYLGLNNLIELLRERFKPDPAPPTNPPKRKRKPEPPLKSPYLQKLKAALYIPPSHKKFRPDPLPNLDDLNEPYEEDPPVPKPPPPPPPPPPPKKRLPRSLCDKMAGIDPIEPFQEVTSVTMKTTTHTSHKKKGGSLLTEVNTKKTYGICITRPKKGAHRKRLKSPKTGLPNAQYLIQGVFTICGKTVYVLGSVSITPADGDLIHGGFRYIDGNGYINIHCGYRGFPPPTRPDLCDCIKRYHDPVFKYVKSTKCYCHHHYDYGHEGTFPPDELPYFTKPTGNAPYEFNYQTIYNMDDNSLLVEKEFKRFWDTDSIVGPKNAQSKAKTKKKKRSSKTCLGQDPKPEDYLKCALRLMRRQNMAAKLPDVHRTPELTEWMRRRIFGPYSQQERRAYLRRTNNFYQTFHGMANKGYGHVSTRRMAMFMGVTNWIQKLDLNIRFRDFSKQYKLDLFRSLAFVNNLFWTSMFHSKFPDKKFREIFFSYLFGTVDDMHLMHPYDRVEIAERSLRMARGRVVCLPDGIEPEE